MSDSNFDRLTQKWQPVLDHEDLDPIKDPYRRSVTAQLLENEEKALREDAEFGQQGLLGETTNISGFGGGTVGQNVGGTNVAGFDPVLISLVRRNAPNLMAYDVCGVQPMNGPTGLIFALKANYAPAGAIGDEALFGEANSSFSGISQGAGSHAGALHAGDMDDMIETDAGSGGADSVITQPGVADFASGNGAPTATAEIWGNADNSQIPEMGFTITKTAVAAQTRALKAEYTTELAQDLKAVHGLDAEAELANILSTEINAEINREVIRKIALAAKLGTGANTAATSAGYVNLSSATHQDDLGTARWLVERFKLLAWYIEKENNKIGIETRRGKGNILITSPDVASALSTSGVLDPSPALNSDVNGSTFAGTIGGGVKVYVDPYHSVAASHDWMIQGYKGTSAYDAGVFYCPYVPLQMVRAVGENTFQPKIGFKTRYGFVDNPFSGGLAHNNVYYRKTLVTL
jgi:hypothetical protein